MRYRPAGGPGGILRRLAAGCYDGLLVGALLMLTIGLATLITRPPGAHTTLEPYPDRLLYTVLALSVIVAYFGICWTRSGETLGMKAWGLRVVERRGALLAWPRVALRLMLALPLWLAPVAGLLLYMRHGMHGPIAALTALPLILSLAFAWRGGTSVHDRLSATRVLRVQREAPA
jgi:uncharacterized RDD family membrane protein YckC